ARYLEPAARLLGRGVGPSPRFELGGMLDMETAEADLVIEDAKLARGGRGPRAAAELARIVVRVVLLDLPGGEAEQDRAVGRAAGELAQLFVASALLRHLQEPLAEP